MELLAILFLQKAQGNLSFIVTFPAFSLLIIIFVFSTFTFNPFDPNAPLQTFSVSFGPSSVLLILSHRHRVVLLHILTYTTEGK